MTRTEYNLAVKQFSNRLYRYVLKCLRDEEAAKDIVQDSFLKLWENRQKVNYEKSKSWLFTTAHNTLINYINKQKKMVPMEQVLYEEPRAGGPRFEMKEVIDKALDKLPDIQRSIVLLRDLEGYRYDEIGKIQDLSESQVKVYLFRGRKKIKDYLKEINVLS